MTIPHSLPVVGVLGAWLAIAQASAQATFTLEQVMGAPFASGLTAAPKGARLAWVLNSRGVRNIWVAQAPGYKARSVTRYDEDDGQEISGLTWTPDGESIVFVRGGAANREGTYPNPLSNPAGAEQALWIVPVRGGEPRRLDEGASPAISPKGDRLV